MLQKGYKSSTQPGFFANPLHQLQWGVASILPTDTILLRTVFHEAQAVLCPLMLQVQTQEELEELIGDLSSLEQVLKSSFLEMNYTLNYFGIIHRKSCAIAEQCGAIHDPPLLNPKGRLRMQRLTNSATEGRAQGGGGDTAQKRLAAAGNNHNR